MIKEICVSVLILSMFSGVCSVGAQEKYTIKEMTPQVQKALEDRRERYPELEQLKIQGMIGETNQGYVQNLKSDVQAQVLVDDENADRTVIYQTIAQQNNLGGMISTIESVFGQVQREKAAAGHMVQIEDGSWIEKQ